eukprot:m.1057 g.1057  ORF g.1057 m.1057 type:complete len:58 (-) comp597_c0_seq1:64-237(-)
MKNETQTARGNYLYDSGNEGRRRNTQIKFPQGDEESNCTAMNTIDESVNNGRTETTD